MNDPNIIEIMNNEDFNDTSIKDYRTIAGKS